MKALLVGLWGHEVYARELVADPRVQLTAVSAWPGCPASMRARLGAFAAEHDVPLLDEPLGTLRRERPEVALVMVPPRLNPEICAAMLVQGVPTISEKPLAGDPAGAALLAEAVRASDAWYTACFPLSRFEPRLAAHLERVEAARFVYLAGHGPRYLATEPHYRDPALPDDALSGGEAAMFSGYGVVALEHLVGSRIVAVQASCGSAFYASYRQQAMEDVAEAVLWFENGATGSLTVGRTPDPHGAVIELELVGEGYHDYRSRRDGGPSPELPRRFIADFLDAVEQDRPPRISGEDALSTIAVLDAIYRSAAAGEPVNPLALGRNSSFG